MVRPHRGIMLDVGRRFVPVALLLTMVDAMAYTKMNVLHLHAADFGGVRIESKVKTARVCERECVRESVCVCEKEGEVRNSA